MPGRFVGWNEVSDLVGKLDRVQDILTKGNVHVASLWP
jgi:hypothetical protein